MQQLWLTLSRQSYFYYDKQWIYCFQLSWRPSTAHILVFTSNKRILTQLSLGVRSYFYDKDESTDRTVTDINDIAKKRPCRDW
jgi:hypothetical protein